MTKVLSTFNKQEKSRFEAFRRSTFAGDAISKYVAHCLQASQEQSYARGEKTRQLLGGNCLGVPSHATRALQRCPYVKYGTTPSRPLEDMVVPGQAGEITVVVSTLAKAYAQRLVTAARRVAAAEGVDETQPLQLRHIQAAFHSRQKAGLDPGFFLQNAQTTSAVPSGAAMAAALGTVDEYELKRKAALAAQDEYDKYVEHDGGDAMDEDQETPNDSKKHHDGALSKEEKADRENMYRSEKLGEDRDHPMKETDVASKDKEADASVSDGQFKEKAVLPKDKNMDAISE